MRQILLGFKRLEEARSAKSLADPTASRLNLHSFKTPPLESACDGNVAEDKSIQRDESNGTLGMKYYRAQNRQRFNPDVNQPIGMTAEALRRARAAWHLHSSAAILCMSDKKLGMLLDANMIDGTQLTSTDLINGRKLRTTLNCSSS